jgi:hypothetical protein
MQAYVECSLSNVFIKSAQGILNTDISFGNFSAMGSYIAGSNNLALILMTESYLYSGVHTGFALRLASSTNADNDSAFGFSCQYTITSPVFCLIGKYLERTSCKVCPDGTFNNVTLHRLNRCKSCSEECTWHTMESKPCSARSDRNCSRAPNVHYICDLGASPIALTGSGLIFSGVAGHVVDINQYCWGTFLVERGKQVLLECSYSMPDTSDFAKIGLGLPDVYTAFEDATAALQDVDRLSLSGLKVFSGVQFGFRVLWSSDDGLPSGTGLMCAFNVTAIQYCGPGEYVLGSSCVTCPVNTFQEAKNHTFKACSACSLGFTTDPLRPTFCGLCG